MKIMWAPWRIKYILSAVKKTNECIFCKIISYDREKDKENLILHRGDTAFIVLNKYPYNNGHLLIVPYSHVPSLEYLSDEEILEMMKLVKYSILALRKAMNPDGFNVGINIGRVAGAGVEDHVHIHIVPRWNGDTNFMPVLAETKVISESLQDSYERISKALREILG